MPIKDALLGELEYESANTRKVLERVPDDKLDWRPHPKSWTLGELASHVANIPHWGTATLGSESFDVMPEGGEPYREEVAGSTAELLARLDGRVAALREALSTASDEALLQPWSLLAGGKTVFTMPRAGVLRGMILNHTVHHRGQLTVYLRLLDVPLPSIYGPSADEQMPF